MIIEDGIFKCAIIDFGKLEEYGFIKSDSVWNYTKIFMNGDFKAVICIDFKGKVSGKVYEVETNDEYLPLRVENMEGFAGDVRFEYKKILEDVKAKCCHVSYFVHSQANRLTRAIYNEYDDVPVFPWDKFRRHGVFKNPHNGKWYALIMSIDKSKLDKKLFGEAEVMNIKLKEDKILELLKQKGFYPAYHMNKKSWISIILDDTISDNILLDLIAESHAFTLGKKQCNHE